MGAAISYFVWDDEVAGFGVRIMPSGAKTYQAQYRTGLPAKQEQPCFRIGTEGLRRAVLGAHGPSDAVPVIRLEEGSHGSASTYVLTTGHLRSITLSRASTMLPQSDPERLRIKAKTP